MIDLLAEKEVTRYLVYLAKSNKNYRMENKKKVQVPLRDQGE